MARILLASLALIGLVSTADAGQQPRYVLAPTPVSPASSILGSTTIPIDVERPVSCPCALRITNGSATSTPFSSTRVLAGWVWVDGRLVLTPIQVSFLRASASTVLNLGRGAHRIRLQLTGLRTSYVTVSLTGTVSTTDLATPRADHSATLLPDGTVLVAGGDGAAGVLDSTELIAGDASGGAVSAPMLIARAAHAAALVPGAGAVLAGGRDASANLSDVEVLTPLASSRGVPAIATVRRNGNLVVLYTYDANGNRLSAEGEAGLVAGTYDDQDRLLTYGGATYTYTANGELAAKTVGGQTTSYVYDTLGNLLQVTTPGGQVITYTIDGRGRRVGKSINGTRVKGWLYADQLRPIAELDGDGQVVSRFVYGTKPNVPEYMIRDGVTYRIVSDHLGSPRVVVNAATGAVVQRMDFQAFGEIIQDSNPGWQPFGFAGGLYDPDSGILRFGARDYDTATGRWFAKDPIGLEAGTNIYEYVGSSPVDRVDPSGLDWFRSKSEAGEYAVGRRGDPLVPTGGVISRFIENWVPAGRTFGLLHDEWVGYVTEDLGLPDRGFNIPSMPGLYLYAVEQEATRSLTEISQSVTDWFNRSTGLANNSQYRATGALKCR